jgi:ABC-type branched-subunit amino acid transport system permease subunit
MMDDAMTAIRLVPFPVHIALRLATALATVVAPFAVGFSAAGTVVAVAVGAIVAGSTLRGIPDERGQVPYPIADIHALEWGAILGLFGAAVVLGLSGDTAALVTLGAIATLQALGNLTTRYSMRG